MSRTEDALGVTGPRAFEIRVAQLFKDEGYTTTLGPYQADGGIDVFAECEGERIAVQAKMYGGSTSKVNPRMVFELYGAAAFNDCTGSAIVTDGQILASAVRAAKKLGVRLVPLSASASRSIAAREVAGPIVQAAPITPQGLDFQTIWQRSIVPLAGKTLSRANGDTNVITKVDGAGVHRITSNGRPGLIPIETIRWAIQRVLTKGQVTRDEINASRAGRVSSGVALLLDQVPEFEVGGRPMTIRLRSQWVEPADVR